MLRTVPVIIRARDSHYEQKLRVCQHAMERAMLRISLRDREKRGYQSINQTK